MARHERVAIANQTSNQIIGGRDADLHVNGMLFSISWKSMR